LKNKRITLKEAVKFHGHLGPYLILGILAGELALKHLNCKKYFGLDVKVRGASRKPKSCFIDGLQLSCGATYGKGNIENRDGRRIEAIFRDCRNNKKIKLHLAESLAEKLDSLRGHRDSEALARKLYKAGATDIFSLSIGE
jgi:formylmethanofuran dehydrogenase subunit E